MFPLGTLIQQASYTNLDAHSVYGFVSRTVELLCAMDITKQGATTVFPETRSYVEDHFHSLNRVDTCSLISSVVD
jgi:hypothetical protein